MSILFKAAELFESPAELVKHVPHWNKYCAMSEILDDSLAGIGEKHERGDLRDFSTPELSNLVCALFEDSEKRQAFLQAVATA